MITDHEYPHRVAFNLLNQILDEFLQKHPKIRWTTPLTSGATRGGRDVPVTPFQQLKEYLVKYQNPHEADSILRVQKEIDETKVILHKTIESMLDRGERLDQLVDKSEKLSAQSKTFYKVAQKTNACSCSIQ
jgi:synaptobrevin homolog YKT6